LIAADTSTVIAFLAGDVAPDTERLLRALNDRTLYLPPPVVAELAAGASIDTEIGTLIARSPLIPLQPDYWTRAGAARRWVQSKGLKAGFADALIAQCCVDADVALIARDADFRHFAAHCGLKLAV
jgi:predicted nucleic acid-binding protein